MSGSLAEKEIEAALAALNDGELSEDGEDFDDDNIDYYSNVGDLLHELEDKPLDNNEDPPIVYEEEHLSGGASTAEPVAGTSSQISTGNTGDGYQSLVGRTTRW